jgi:hypothetical protein
MPWMNPFNFCRTVLLRSRTDKSAVLRTLIWSRPDKRKRALLAEHTLQLQQGACLHILLFCIALMEGVGDRKPLPWRGMHAPSRPSSVVAQDQQPKLTYQRQAATFAASTCHRHIGSRSGILGRCRFPLPSFPSGTPHLTSPHVPYLITPLPAVRSNSLPPLLRLQRSAEHGTPHRSVELCLHCHCDR